MRRSLPSGVQCSLSALLDSDGDTPLRPVALRRAVLHREGVLRGDDPLPEEVPLSVELGQPGTAKVLAQVGPSGDQQRAIAHLVDRVDMDVGVKLHRLPQNLPIRGDPHDEDVKLLVGLREREGRKRAHPIVVLSRGIGSSIRSGAG